MITSEINDKEKEKLIFQMAYRCEPPELPDVEDLLKQRRKKRIDVEITPRSRQAERKIYSTRYSIWSYLGRNS